MPNELFLKAKYTWLGLRTMNTCRCENDNRQTDTAVPPAGVTSSNNLVYDDKLESATPNRLRLSGLRL
jgi:hypothetical protein